MEQLSKGSPFEKQVFQQFKNHQDFINNTNSWIQAQEEKLRALMLDFLKERAATDSRQKSQEILIDTLKDQLKAHKAEVLQITRDLMTKSDRAIQGGEKRSEAVARHSDAINGLFEVTDRHSKSISTLEAQISRILHLIESQTVRMQDHFKSHLGALKQEILSAPSELPGFKKEIAELLKCWEVTVSGFTDDLKNIKKAAFISSKYIEDLYTQLSKLKTEIHEPS